MRYLDKLLFGLGLSASCLALSGSAAATSRTEAIVRAKAFSFHPWTCKSANLTASCNGAYKSVNAPGDYMGLPYDWGGFMSLFEFDQQILAGYGAGSYPADGILECTAGLDCSGFVSQAWKSGHITTSTADTVSSVVSLGSMLPGDIFNDAGNHMAMYSHKLNNGDPVLYESVFYNVHLSMPGWSWVNGFVPRRYDKITGTSAATPDGTLDNPGKIGSFPYVDSRNTATSMSDLLDGCGTAPNTDESGPEVVYQVTLTQPGQLTVSVQDDTGVDIDVHLYTSQNTNDCVARADSTFTEPVDCGSYYVVADTWASGGTPLSGNYTLTVDFAPSSGQACGGGPPKYDFKGAPGTACAYPGNENLPFCNPNLGADTCLYTSSSSFCSMPCQTTQDCGAWPGSCCGDIGNQEKYCLPAAQCGSAPPDAGVSPKPDAGGDPDSGFAGGGNAGGSGNAGGGGGFGNAGSGAAPGTGAYGGFSTGGNGNGVAPASSGSDGGCSTTPRPTAPTGWLLAGLGVALTWLRRRS